MTYEVVELPPSVHGWLKFAVRNSETMKFDRGSYTHRVVAQRRCDFLNNAPR